MKAHERFLLLDGLRGVAALAVVAYHFGNRADLPQLLPRGYLAVDFFFVLSGFVIAHAYGERIRTTLPGWRFIRLRLIRLLPMLVPGTIFGALIEYWRPHVGSAAEHQLVVVATAILGCLAIPFPFHTSMEQTIFPINGPVWSMFFEIVANGVYLLVAGRSHHRALAFALMAAGGIALSVHTLQTGGVNGGFQITGWPWGFPRVAFSFFAGVLLNRSSLQVRALPGWSYPAMLIVVMLLPVDHSTGSALVDLACVLLVFPAIVASGRQAALQPRAARWCNLSGEMSYPLYAIHYPIVRGICFVVLRHGFSTIVRLTIAGITVSGVAVLALIVLRFYDEPVRRWLSQRSSSAKLLPVAGGFQEKKGLLF